MALAHDGTLTVQDKIRLHLESYGQKEIPVTLEEIAKSVGETKNSVYQAIHRLHQYNEIDLEKETLDNGRERIIGIKLIRLRPSGRSYRRSPERRNSRVTRIYTLPPVDAALDSDSAQAINDGQIPALPELVNYLEKKLAIEDMKARALSANLDPSVIKFEPELLGEEGIILLKLYTDLKSRHEKLQGEHRLQGFDLEAEQRNVENLKRKLREETNQDLLAIGSKRDR